VTLKNSFIPHIAGLRGIAVLLVVLGHFGIPGFAAGFIGVDVFFVISGFLITGILVEEYERSRDPETRVGSISLKNFYLRRARRILPASIVVTITIVLFSWFTNNISRFGTIAGDAIWSTLFSANLNFAIKATDYFQIGAAPSLHLAKSYPWSTNP
jgi:peptidoglycan/LPS O-acetylase OafA/YrhL